MSSNTSVYRAGRDNAESVIDLLSDFAVESGYLPIGKEARVRLLESGWGSNPRFTAWIVKEGESIVGIATTTDLFSTFDAKPSLYLEDLFVVKRYRGKGIARLLVAALVEECEKHGYTRIDWTCSDLSGPVVDFYESIGGTMLQRSCFRLLPKILDPR